MSNSTKPFILGFYGASYSGKTNLITKITEQLTKAGQRVAVVKKSDQHISIDTPGKDTFRHAQAGASLVIFSSEIETAYLLKQKSTIEKIVKNACQIGDFDFIFIEGADEEEIPKVRVGSGQERENTVFIFDGDFDKLFQRIIQRDL